MKKLFLGVVGFSVLLLVLYSFLKPSPVVQPPKEITSFDAQNIGNVLEKEDLIRLSYPVPNQIITSPLEIDGTARGTWFFEADFPVKLYDEQANVIGTAVAQAQGEWMTEEFVAFNALLTFTQPSSQKGYLVLEKSNPSGLEENSDELRIPIQFY